MRMSESELKSKYFGQWNDAHSNIQRVLYGDDPHVVWDAKEYARYREWAKTDSTWANIGAIDAYIHSQNGAYNKYYTLMGDVYISASGKVLCGDINVKYRGQTYSVSANKMYGLNGLSIMRFSGGHTTGFTTKDGVGSPDTKRKTEELNKETIEKVLNSNVDDFGDSIKAFMQLCRDIYAEYPENHIMEKTFSL